jgi:hypothetical protein
MVRTEGTLGKSRRTNMAITTAGDRLRKQRLTRQERQFSVNRGAENSVFFLSAQQNRSINSAGQCPSHINASISALASWRSAVSKPSVNQP